MDILYLACPLRVLAAVDSKLLAGFALQKAPSIMRIPLISFPCIMVHIMLRAVIHRELNAHPTTWHAHTTACTLTYGWLCCAPNTQVPPTVQTEKHYFAGEFIELSSTT